MQCKLNKYSIFISKKKKEEFYLGLPFLTTYLIVFVSFFFYFFPVKTHPGDFSKLFNQFLLFFSQMTVNGLNFNVLIFKDVTTGQDLSTVF